MDPYLEDPDLWPPFQRCLVAALAGQLGAGLDRRYRVVTGTRRYVVSGPRGAEAHREDYAEVRSQRDAGLVTLLEVVSPANKATEQGRQAYLGQRRAARADHANLVEVDLVLQGRPTLEYNREGLPKWHHSVTVTRSAQPERYEIYTSTLQKRLPRFCLPLAPGEPDAVLDLQAAFEGCYVAGGYRARIDYGRDPAVPLGEDDRTWLDAMLQEQGLRKPPPAHQNIARAAYLLWEAEGRPHGRDQEHWYRAREQLQWQLGTKGGPARG
jgi:hypothetical protein